MQIRTLRYAVLFISLVVFGSYTPCKELDKNSMLIQVIKAALSQGHYESHKFDDDFSKKVFNFYLKQIDNNKKFLTQSDVDDFKKYQAKIDDEVKDGTYEFFELSIGVLTKRIEKVKEYYTEILSKPFDFKVEESIELDGDKLKFAKNEKELRENWRLYLKYQTMLELADLMEKQEKAAKADPKSDAATKPKSYETLEQEARAKVLKTQNEWHARMTKISKNDWLSTYINSITGTYDPHTTYLPPNDKKNFDIQMSGTFQGIGATLQEKEGYINVMDIMPGSPSWRQGQLKVGDVIMKVAQGEAEPVDVVNMRLDEAVQMIRGKKGTEVRLTVKKIDGTIVVIPIIRETIVLEETYAKSAIIHDDKAGKKIGYIYLPKFYADFNSPEGRSSGDDVKKEILKLKQENIDGVVLDLRNNGGGSLQDVVEMVGLFIESGPVVQVKSREGAPYVLEDRDPSIQYEGPLVVMVNEFSASASEILAAAIQDYKRGAVIGSTSTFGKGTVQRVIDLDGMLPPEETNAKPLGALMLTLQKFYRINGGATQLRGVTPDIILPDTYSYMKMGEKDQDFAMAWDEIKPLKFKEWSQNEPKIAKAKQGSEARVANNEGFKVVNENAQRLKRERDETMVSLNLEKFRTEIVKDREEAKKYGDIQKYAQELDITSLKADYELIKGDTIKEAKAKNWQKNLKKDLYLNEAKEIVKDLM